MNVGKICSRDIDLVDLDETARAAARRMHDRKVGTLLVLDEAERPIGVVTDRDLTLRVLGAAGSPDTTLVRDVMSTPVSTVGEDTAIEEALVAMRAGPFRRMPVVDRGGKVVGVPSVDDVLVALADDLAAIAAVVVREAPHPGSPRR